MKDVEEVVDKEIQRCYYWENCQPYCGGFKNCEDYETTEWVIHTQKAEKRLRVRAEIEKALNNRKLAEIYTCIMHYAMMGETEE